MSIFDKRTNYKPFEYPEVYEFTDAMNKSFWVHSEVDFTRDIQDFHSSLNTNEQIAIKHSLLAIAQVEVAVKTFWWNLYNHFPKPEFNGLGSTFAECEFRHSEAYSRLLEVLWYNKEFERLMDIPVMKKRVEYLDNALKDSKSDERKKYVVSLILFTILIENVSLFSQFAVILSFTRFKWYMKNTANIIAWTSIDEQVHANAGMFLVNKIREEFPDYFDQEMLDLVRETVVYSLDIEWEILDWIFENWDLEIIKKEDLHNFMKFRVDESLSNIWFDKIYNITQEQYKPMQWFEEDVFGNALDDFFAKRPTEYTKHDKSITRDDLF